MKLTSALIAIVLASGSLANAANILLVTNNNTTTQSLNDFLVTTHGHTVTRDERAGGPLGGDATMFDLVIVARETNSGNYDEGTEPQDWNALAVPMIMMGPHIMRSNRWGWISNTSIPGTTATAWDSATVFRTPTTNFNVPSNNLVAGATVSETIGGNPSVFFIPSGTVMANSRGTAGADRYGFVVGAEGHWDNSTAASQALFVSTIDAALVPEPSTTLLSMIGAGLVVLRRRRK